MRNLFFCCFWLLLSASALAQSNYFVKFPDDIVLTNPDSIPYSEPQILVVSGDAPTVSYEDVTYTIVPDACIKIERRWMVRSAAFNPMMPCIQVPNPGPNAVHNHPDNLPGAVVSPAGTPAPWAPSLVKVDPSSPAPTDFSTFWSDTANCYQYTQWIKLVDNEAPSFEFCYQFCPIVFDETPNDPLLWNALAWLNPGTGSHNLSEAPAEWQIAATDAFNGANLTVSYLLFLDTDQDGIMETTVNSSNPPLPGQVNVGNTFNPNFSGGTPTDFDQRPVPADQKYRFALRQTVDGDSRTATLLWNTEAAPSAWVTPQFPPGTHKIKWIVADACGNEIVCEHLFGVSANNLANLQTLQGTTVADADADCEAGAGEPLLPGWRARLEAAANPGDPLYTLYSTSFLDGKYRFWVDTGDYLLTIQPPNGYWEICQDELPVHVDSVGGVTVNDFAAQSFVDCPFLETDIGTWGLRRCFDNTYTVRYCNTGTATADDAFLRLTLDPFMTFVDSEQFTGIDEGNNVWRFNIGDIVPGDCGFFRVTIHLDCDSTVLGQTHCIEAHIYPDTFCLDAPGWSGAHVEVAGACQPDSVRFVISNTGTAPSSMLDYIVIEDNIINLQGSFQLPAGDFMEIAVPANGSTWRVEAQQEPGDPLNPAPSATVGACGLNGDDEFSYGYVSQFGEDDRDPFVSIDCHESQGSFDPNDKQGYPLGYGDEHRIPRGQPLEYLIRFQNTGTDTAFQVLIRDTLPVWLDPSSVVTGAASHPYRFEMSGAGVLDFAFENILLPDSSVNETASHGFVKFRVDQRPGIPLGTLIQNRAAIFFDFNEPVLTNVTQHTVDENFVLVHTDERPGKRPQAPLMVSPNPAGAGDRLRLQGIYLSEGRFDLFDGLGRLALSRPVAANEVALGNTGIPAGVYGFRVTSRSGICRTGWMIWR